MKVLLVACAAMTVALLTGCVSYRNQAPNGYVPLAALGTTATYDVIADAKGTATGGFLFGFIPIGGENKIGTIGGGLGLPDPVMGAAVYNAIESVPTADALLAPRFEAETKSYVIYSEKTVTVKGKAIRYNPSGK